MEIKSKSDNKVLFNSEMTIQDNIIASDGNFMQISNISRVWHGTVPTSTNPALLKAGICAFIFGLISAFLGSLTYSDDFLGFSVFAVILGITFIVLYVVPLFKNPQYAINIQLNSGSIYSFASSDKNIILKIYEVLYKIIKDNQGNENVNIDFSNGIIIDNKGGHMRDNIVSGGSNNNIVTGDGNQGVGVTNQGYNSSNAINIGGGNTANPSNTAKSNSVYYNQADIGELTRELKLLHNYYVEHMGNQEETIMLMRNIIGSLESNPQKSVDNQFTKFTYAALSLAKELSLGLLSTVISKATGLI